ncbi:nuclease-related domain-containing protein [Halomonas korlensis]|uniref:Replication restart DNA helicase PriA n=1 Tax=Halomonas korlensis TaxID=463301 RepID=A0A1I7FJS6_9GAMM|nr:nuclease-related domain-containing protein [Halomonas korlensis]SFU36414.1 replication restart DNA helicase PriA [Halomonas korlensis]
MILKEKDAFTGSDRRGYYGHQQEQDVAFYLRREFANDEQIAIINDLLVTHNGENAQIDHLVIHPFGFLVIESKSIHGEVSVNAQGEWSRSYRGDWSGMPSPIRQAELQQALLKSLLRDNVERFIGKLLGIQGGVGGRTWEVLCAVSSSAILNREEMPKPIGKVVVKSEFIAEHVRKTIGPTGARSLLSTKPKFSMGEMSAMGRFLLDHDAAKREASAAADAPALTGRPVADPACVREAVKPEPTTSVQQAGDVSTSRLCCKSCNESMALEGRYGKFGYYVKCHACGTNTSMKAACQACASKNVRVSKSGATYTASCSDCSSELVVFQAS